MPFKESSFNILIVGGSQGAVKINSAVCSILDSLKKYNISIVHQTGEKDFLRVSEHYSRFKINSKVIPFIENISESYEFAHLIICRAGAGTVSEILTIERPTIFIPLAISNAHQFYNIKDLEAANACNYLVQDENLEKNLLNLVVKYIESPEYLKEMLYNLSEYKSRNDIQDGTLALTNSILELLSLH
jgi:UDP-N-acetylglucosamine--N-acetylmuramyl-(pentapeptide) pyrophosphoryl-undecaprenol N-acetylglucosamine transferase